MQLQTLNFEAILTAIGDLVTRGWSSDTLGYLYPIYYDLKFIATFLCIILFIILVYVEIQLGKMAKHEEEHDAHAAHEYGPHAHGGHGEEEHHNTRWEKIQEHVNSENPSDWRLAILESDIVLEEMLEKMGYHGDTVAEKLKSIEPQDFTSLNSAWEAHKIRNAIAHEGSDFLISEREAKRVVRLYEEVFKEFHFI